jgi:integrase
VRIQQGWITTEGPSLIGHVRVTRYDGNGKPTRKPIGRRIGPADMDKREALEALQRMVVSETGITSDGTMTVEGFTKSKWIPLHEGDWRVSSRETILQKLSRIYERFEGIALKDIDNVMLQTYLNTLAETQSESTVKMARAYIKSIFGEALEQDYIRKNPARSLRVPKQLKPTKRPYLTMEEIASLLKAASPFGIVTQEFALLRLLLVTGMRPSEVLALKWRHIDLTPENSTVTLDSSVYHGQIRNYTKATREGEVQTLVLEELAAQVLTQWSVTCLEKSGKDALDPDAYVFQNSDGGFWSSGNLLHRVLQPIAKRAGIATPLTFQMLRRTVLTWAADLGSMKDAQAIARHKTAQITANVYAQIIAPSVRETAGKLGRKMAGRTSQSAPAQATN